MIVRLYHFSKRNRSTKQPAQTDTYQEINVALKEGTSVINPVLLCQTVNAAAFNYLYIPTWNRYYFISNGQSIENMWEIVCTEDYLASYKATILLTYANILYATGSTKNIPDNRIPVLADLLVGHTSTNINGATILDDSFGTIVLGITGKGSFGNYICYPADLIGMIDGVDNWWATDVQSQLEAAKQLFYGGSAAENLKSAIALPFTNMVSGSDIQEEIILGGYPTGKNGYRILDPIINFTGSISIPWQSTDWKKVSAYTSILLYLPFIGVLGIPATEAQNDSSLSYNYAINKTSGDISVEIKGSTSGRIFAVCSGNCAMSTAYGSTGIDTNKATAAIVSGIGTIGAGIVAAAGGGIASLAAVGAGLATTANNILSSLGGSSQGSGGLGGGSSQGLDKQIHCFVTQKQLSDSQTNFDPIMGKPYMGVAAIGSFTGYVQTDGFQLADIQAYSEEKDMINQLMDSGVYIE